jgi:hypothetical protein
LVKTLKNVLAVGRCLSATHDAQGATRLVPTTIAVAQGCGTAAAREIKENKALRDIDIPTLQEALLS